MGTLTEYTFSFPGGRREVWVLDSRSREFYRKDEPRDRFKWGHLGAMLAEGLQVSPMRGAFELPLFSQDWR